MTVAGYPVTRVVASSEKRPHFDDRYAAEVLWIGRQFEAMRGDDDLDDYPDSSDATVVLQTIAALPQNAPAWLCVLVDEIALSFGCLAYIVEGDRETVIGVAGYGTDPDMVVRYCNTARAMMEDRFASLAALWPNEPGPVATLDEMRWNTVASGVFSRYERDSVLAPEDEALWSALREEAESVSPSVRLMSDLRDDLGTCWLRSAIEIRNMDAMSRVIHRNGDAVAWFREVRSHEYLCDLITKIGGTRWWAEVVGDIPTVVFTERPTAYADVIDHTIGMRVDANIFVACHEMAHFVSAACFKPTPPMSDLTLTGPLLTHGREFTACFADVLQLLDEDAIPPEFPQLLRDAGADVQERRWPHPRSFGDEPVDGIASMVAVSG